MRDLIGPRFVGVLVALTLLAGFAWSARLSRATAQAGPAVEMPARYRQIERAIRETEEIVSSGSGGERRAKGRPGRGR